MRLSTYNFRNAYSPNKKTISWRLTIYAFTALHSTWERNFRTWWRSTKKHTQLKSSTLSKSTILIRKSLSSALIYKNCNSHEQSHTLRKLMDHWWITFMDCCNQYFHTFCQLIASGGLSCSWKSWANKITLIFWTFLSTWA